MPETIEKFEVKKNRRTNIPKYSLAKVGVIVSIFLPLLLLINTLFVIPPADFPVGKTVVIPEGATVKQIAETFENREIIRSPILFSVLVKAFGSEDKVIAGEYFFSQKLALYEVISRVTGGEYGLDPIKVRIPEGATVEEIGDILAKRFPDISADRFVSLAAGLEGYLFPDTYYWLPIVREDQVIKEMSQNFQNKLEPLLPDIQKSNQDLHEIVTMASLVEGEASNSNQERKVIAGILWKRIEIDMPLQVDAVFKYIVGRGGLNITKADLKIDSPYNTYKNKGLPPGPINNPGLSSIVAAINPSQSPYLFYLHDKYGNIHYASNYNQHSINARKYLRN